MQAGEQPASPELEPLLLPDPLSELPPPELLPSDPLSELPPPEPPPLPELLPELDALPLLEPLLEDEELASFDPASLAALLPFALHPPETLAPSQSATSPCKNGLVTETGAAMAARSLFKLMDISAP